MYESCDGHASDSSDEEGGGKGAGGVARKPNLNPNPNPHPHPNLNPNPNPNQVRFFSMFVASQLFGMCITVGRCREIWGDIGRYTATLQAAA